MATQRHQNALPNGYLFEGYRIEGVLGAGSFGVTYSAREVAIDRLVAIKEYMPAGIATRDPQNSSVHPISSADEEEFEWGLERFQLEASTLVSFRHPNIVPVFRFFEANGTAYMVMEYQQGQSLSQLLMTGKKLTENEIYEIIDPLLDGLERVHMSGFLHRDIKPGNIYLRDDGSPVLIDFGAARQALGERSRSLTRIFTPGYAPHEQYETSGNQGPWTDIYALGAVMYLMVTDTPPIDAPTRLSAWARGNDDPLTPSIKVARRGFSQNLLETIDRSLAVMEQDRPQSVAELRGHLLGREGEEVPSGRLTGTIMPAGERERRARARPEATAVDTQAGTVRDPAPSERRLSWRLAAMAFAGVLLLSGVGFGAYVATDGFGTGEESKRIEEARRKAEEEKRRQAEIEAERRREAEIAAKRKAEEEEAKRKAEAQRKADEEAARRKAEAEAKRKADEAEVRRTAEAKRQEEEAKRRAEAKRKEAAKRAAEAKRKAALEAERKAQLEAKRKRDAEIRRQVEAEIKRREEARRKAEAEAKRRAALEAERKRRNQTEAERRRQAALEAERQRRAQAEIEAERRRRAALDAEAKRRAALEAERRRRAALEAERQRRLEAERKRKETQVAAVSTRLLATFNGRSVAFNRSGFRSRYYIIYFNAGGRLRGVYSSQAETITQDYEEGNDTGRWFVRGDRLCLKWNRWDGGRTICHKVQGSGRRYAGSGGGLLGGGFTFR